VTTRLRHSFYPNFPPHPFPPTRCQFIFSFFSTPSPVFPPIRLLTFIPPTFCSCYPPHPFILVLPSVPLFHTPLALLCVFFQFHQMLVALNAFRGENLKKFPASGTPVSPCSSRSPFLLPFFCPPFLPYELFALSCNC